MSTNDDSTEVAGHKNIASSNSCGVPFFLLKTCMCTAMYIATVTLYTYFCGYGHAVQPGQQHNAAAALADGLDEPQGTDVLVRVNPGNISCRNTVS